MARNHDGASDPRPVILHLAVDVNTPQRVSTTNAIEWFVAELGEFDNVIVGYRRTPKFWALQVAAYGASGASRLYDFPFFGLPLGIGLLASMRLAANRTIQRLEHDGIRPDLVHAHKLTFEGLSGWYVARHFGVPLFVSLRGEVESKVFRAKLSYRPLLRRISTAAARVYFVSAWFRPTFHRYVPAQFDKERLLPNIVRNVVPTIAPQPGCDRFVSIFNLDTWRRKGLRWLLRGFAEASKIRPGMKLDIIGGGSAKAIETVEQLIAAHGLQQQVTLLGQLPNAEVIARLPHYRALLLPSLNETFGMVYVEALFAGVPILFTEATAIDGYLDGLDVAITVPPRDWRKVAAGILTLDERNAELRANLADAAMLLYERFDPVRTLAEYRAAVRETLGLAPSADSHRNAA